MSRSWLLVVGACSASTPAPTPPAPVAPAPIVAPTPPTPAPKIDEPGEVAEVWPPLLAPDRVPAVLRAPPEQLPRGAIGRLGSRLHRLGGTAFDERQLAFTADGRLHVTSRIEGGLVTRDLVSGAEIRKYKVGPWAANFAITADGKRVAHGCSVVTIADAGGNKIITISSPVKRERPSISVIGSSRGEYSRGCSAFSPDGSRIVHTFTRGDGTHVYDATTGVRITTLKPTCNSHAIAWSSGGNFIGCTTKEGVVAVVDATSGSEVARVAGREAFAFGIDGKSMATIGEGKATVYALPGGAVTKSFAVLPNRVASAAALSHDGAFLAVATEHATRVFETSSGKMVPVPDGHDAVVDHIASSPDGSMIVTGSSHDGTVLVWNAATRTVAREIERGVGRVAIAIAPDGKRLAVVRNFPDHTGRVAFYELGTGALIGKPTKLEWFARRAAFAPDGRLFGAGDEFLYSFDGERTTMFGVEDAGASFAFSPDGKLVITGRPWRNGNAAVISLDGSPTRWLEHKTPGVAGFDGGVNAVAINPAGTRVAIATGGGVFLFDLASGKRYGCLPGRANALAFDPGGKYLVAGLENGDVEVWSATAFATPVWRQTWSCPGVQPVAKHRGHRGRIQSLSVVDRRTVVTAGSDGDILLWRLP